MGQNPGGGNSNSRGQSIIKENCRNSRTSDDIDMKPVTKPDKRNKTPSKNFNANVMSKNYDPIVIFRIYD